MRLGWALAALGEFDDAENAFEVANQISPASMQSLAGLAFVAARKGDLTRAHSLLETMLPTAAELGDPFTLAIVYVGLEDTANAVEWLTRVAHESRILHRSGPYGIDSPIYDPFRDDPGFKQIAQEVAEQRNQASAVPQPSFE